MRGRGGRVVRWEGEGGGQKHLLVRTMFQYESIASSGERTSSTAACLSRHHQDTIGVGAKA